MNEIDLTPENVPRIVESLRDRSSEELSRLVEDLLRVYVSGGARPFHGAKNFETWVSQYPDFAALVGDLKRYAKYPELENLVIEGNQVRLRVSGNLIPLGDPDEQLGATASPSSEPGAFTSMGPGGRPADSAEDRPSPQPDRPKAPERKSDPFDDSGEESGRRLMEFDEGEE